jgi:hypothetical protein
MKIQMWILLLFVLLLAAVSVAGALASDGSAIQTTQPAEDQNAVSLGKTGPLAQMYAGGVVVVLVLLSLAPLALGYEPGAGINL